MAERVPIFSATTLPTALILPAVVMLPPVMFPVALTIPVVVTLDRENVLATSVPTVSVPPMVAAVVIDSVAPFRLAWVLISPVLMKLKFVQY